MFIRFLSSEIDERSQVAAGLFCAASKLRWTDDLPDYEFDALSDLRNWFNIHWESPFDHLPRTGRYERAICNHYNLQFRAEMFNAFNHTNFNGVDTALSLGETEKLPDGRPNPNFGKPLNPNFGRITATRGPREIQFALKFNF